MARIRTFTGSKVDVIPEGTRRFIVNGEVKQKPIANGTLYLVPLQFDEGIGEQAFFANTIGTLLRTLGCTEIAPDDFEWDTAELEGRAFNAIVTHVADKKDHTKIRSQMKVIPSNV